MRKVLDEPSVKVRKPDKGLDFLFQAGCGLLRNSCDLYWIHFDVIVQDDNSEVFDLGLLEFALVMLEVEFVFTEALHDQATDVAMFFQCVCEDENVVEVNTHNAFQDQVMEDVVHHRLEGRRAVR